MQTANSAIYCGVVEVIKTPIVVIVPYVKACILTNTVSVTTVISVTVKVSESSLQLLVLHLTN